MLKIINDANSKEWNSCVKSFENWDIYYTYEYAYSFKLHGDGEPLLIYYEDQECRFCYVVMKNDISTLASFQGALNQGEWYDVETPYGYGGPLCTGSVSAQSAECFVKEMTEYCVANHIITQFVRFHPLLNNWEILPSGIETKYLRDTIYMDTSSKEIIWQNLDSKNRNMIRKAQKNGVSIEISPIDNYEKFIPMYNATMSKNQAEDYYTFGKDYFEYLNSMKENACIFYAMYEGKPISASIMFYNDKYMHYHLSGSDWEYRNLSAGNLLLYEAACWACEKGIKQFHLGGGLAPDDSLFGFKKQFNKNDRASFVVGRTIFDHEKYNYLKDLRKKLDAQFDVNNGFMIQYRR